MTVRAPGLFDALTPAQREALARRQTDPRAAALVRGVALDAPAVAADPKPRRVRLPRNVAVEARAELGAVILTAKGLRLVNASNAREHWRTRHRRVAGERAVLGGALAPMAPPPGPWRVTITRDGRGTMDDDGLAASAKGVRDAVAAWLGVDDAPGAPVTWRYGQRRARGYAVTVHVEGEDAHQGEAPSLDGR